MRYTIGLAVTAIVIQTAFADASCILKKEKSKDYPGCYYLVGYSDGKRVGKLHRPGEPTAYNKGCHGVKEYNQIASFNGNFYSYVSGDSGHLADDCLSNY